MLEGGLFSGAYGKHMALRERLKPGPFSSSSFSDLEIRLVFNIIIVVPKQTCCGVIVTSRVPEDTLLIVSSIAQRNGFTSLQVGFKHCVIGGGRYLQLGGHR